MMQHRKQWLDDLARSVTEHHWSRCAELGFRILYALPSELQIRLACFSIGRYLPIFEAKWPNIKWPRHLMNDLSGWVKQFERQVPDEPDRVDPADAAFLFCFDALLLALYYQTNPLTLTSSCVFTIIKAIQARMDNVWIADDPSAAGIWKRFASSSERTPLLEWIRDSTVRSADENVAAKCVAEREWRAIIAYLIDEQVWNYTDVVDIQAMERDLVLWKEHEMVLIVPYAAML